LSFIFSSADDEIQDFSPAVDDQVNLDTVGQLIVDFPTSIVHLNAFFALMRLFLQILIRVESINEIPVHETAEQVLRNMANG